jgi:hypothetical protein
LVFGNRQFAAEEEVFEGILAEDAADVDDLAVPLEVDAVIFDAIPVDFLPTTRELAKFLVVLLEVLREKLEPVDDLQLQFARQCGQFLGAHGIENNLQHGPRIAEPQSRARQDLARSG